jgi:hypothetical protein
MKPSPPTAAAARRRGRSPAAARLRQQQALDAAFARCENLGTLGGLLAALETGRLASVAPETVSHAGAMIVAEARHLAGLIEAVHADFRRPAGTASVRQRSRRRRSG